MVTVNQLMKYLLSIRYTLPIVPPLDDLTVGGKLSNSKILLIVIFHDNLKYQWHDLKEFIFFHREYVIFTSNIENYLKNSFFRICARRW